MYEKISEAKSIGALSMGVPGEIAGLYEAWLRCAVVGSVEVSFPHVNLATGDAIPMKKALSKDILGILTGNMPKGVNIDAKHPEALIELHNRTKSFARKVQYLFSESELKVLSDVLKLVYSPYETFKQRYGQLPIFYEKITESNPSSLAAFPVAFAVVDTETDDYWRWSVL